jgi:hypothetical protein
MSQTKPVAKVVTRKTYLHILAMRILELYFVLVFHPTTANDRENCLASMMLNEMVTQDVRIA